MSTQGFEVVWPLHRAHYLSPALADAGIDMDTESEQSAGIVSAPSQQSSEDTTAPSLAAATHGRALAARALLAGGGSQRRVGELLDASRRTIGRLAEVDITETVRDDQAVAQARTCLEETASRGSTAHERAGAIAWLQHAQRDERQVERVRSKATARRSNEATVTRDARRPAVTPKAATSPSNGAPPQPVGRPHGSMCAKPSLAQDQVNELQRQQRRIVHCTALIAYVRQGGQTLTLDGALGELLTDITEAARTIGTLLQQVGERPAGDESRVLTG